MIQKVSIGRIRTDTGQIAILDPSVAGRIASDKAYEAVSGLRDDAPRGLIIDPIVLHKPGKQTILGRYVNDTILVLSALQGDGSFPVTAEVDPKGRIRRVIIDFSPE